MNVSLTPELEAFIHELVSSGRYASAGEVVREALRLLEDCDELRRLRLAEPRTQAAGGLDALDQGQALWMGTSGPHRDRLGATSAEPCTVPGSR